MTARLLLVRIEAGTEACEGCVHVSDDPESVTGGKWCELFKQGLPGEDGDALRLDECRAAERDPG